MSTSDADHPVHPPYRVADDLRQAMMPGIR